MKGFDIYEKVDRLIADGKLPGFRLRVIGRWPASIRWRSAELFGPMTGRPLAEKLRECHIYLTASRWEPCGMHHVEGAQCGLPLVYHEDGGGIVEAGRRYGLGSATIRPAPCGKWRHRWPEFRAKVLAQLPVRRPHGHGLCRSLHAVGGRSAMSLNRKRILTIGQGSEGRDTRLACPLERERTSEPLVPTLSNKT